MGIEEAEHVMFKPAAYWNMCLPNQRPPLTQENDKLCTETYIACDQIVKQ